MSDPLNRIDNSFQALDQTITKTSEIREVLIKKLFDAAVEYKFEIKTTSPEERESFMSVVNSLDGLLKGKERVALDNVKISLLKRSETDNHSTAEAVTKLLHMINPALAIKSINDIDKNEIATRLEETFITSGATISEDEKECISV